VTPSWGRWGGSGDPDGVPLTHLSANMVALLAPLVFG
jgi:hypothetical protein